MTKLRTAVPSHGGGQVGPAATIAQARALRAEHAQAAAYQGYRAQQARAASHHSDAARWTEEYRRSVARCRLLGDLIRAGGVKSGGAASTVTPLIRPKPASDVPTTGAAA